jgi:hypothetical protein
MNFKLITSVITATDLTIITPANANWQDPPAGNITAKLDGDRRLSVRY